MADLENALSGILSDPDAMMKIKALGEQLGLTGNTESPTSDSKPKPSQGNTLHQGSDRVQGFGASPLDLLTKADPAMLSKLTGFLPILSNMNQQDETTALLNALRPFLSAERRKRLDDAGKILKIMKVLPFIRKSGLL